MRTAPRVGNGGRRGGGRSLRDARTSRGVGESCEGPRSREMMWSTHRRDVSVIRGSGRATACPRRYRGSPCSTSCAYRLDALLSHSPPDGPPVGLSRVEPPPVSRNKLLDRRWVTL